MRTIPLTQGKVAIVDDEEYEALAKHRWCAARVEKTWYAEGVYWNKVGRKWHAQIRCGAIGPSGQSRQVHLGLFDYDGAAIASFGAFARLNFMEGESANSN
jgi:hypothetical protein